MGQGADILTALSRVFDARRTLGGAPARTSAMAQALVRADRLCAWAGGSLLVTSLEGRCDDTVRLSGYYFRETRFLSRCGLTFDGQRPWVCESAAVAPNHLEFTYVWPEVTDYGGGGTGQSGDTVSRAPNGVAQRALTVRLTYELSHGALTARATVANRSRDTVVTTIGWELDADFADIQEVQAGTRKQIAGVARRDVPDGRIFEYEHPQLPLRAVAHAAPQMSSRVTLPPGGETHLELTIEAGLPRADARDRLAHVERWRSGFTRITTPRSGRLEAALAANVRDVAAMPLLDGPPEEWLALQAGVPAYPALFGRDAVTAGWQFAMIDGGEATDGALTKLGRLQADRVDDWRDAEPGRVPQQVRLGPLAALHRTPFDAYYGDFASPLMYVIALANVFAWTGDLGQLDRHWDTARRILDWARDRGDLDGDGYLEYVTRSPDGPKNQGWKDSGDAIVHDDGSPVRVPIATCEIQAYWYAAQQLMALLCAARGEWGDARAWFSDASSLKTRFNRDWWCEDEQFFALAMDPDKRKIVAPSSNVGHCLATGIITRERLEAVVGRLFAPDLFSGWGIRTLSADHVFYDPLSYHRGSVWAVEQATIAFGLRRYDMNGRVHQLAEALVDLAQLYPQYRIPECIGGDARRDRATPGAYPQANAPQLWNATALPLVLQCLLGVIPWARHHLLIVDPVLPVWLPEILVEDLRVGDARATIRFARSADGTSAFHVLRKTGPLHIVRQPPPESISAGGADRIVSFFESLTA